MRLPNSRTLAARPFFAALLALACGWALAQAGGSAPPTQRLRGSIVSFDGATLVVKERSGEVVTMQLAETLAVSEVLPIEMSAIRSGSFVGSAAMPGPDGTLRAREVLVFPEAARGTGEGHFPWDLEPGSTMTNATVADVVAVADGRTLTLRYKDGEKTLQVPPGTPIVTFQPADRSLLVAGARVVVTAQRRDGKPTALRVLAGRDGFVPPM